MNLVWKRKGKGGTVYSFWIVYTLSGTSFNNHNVSHKEHVDPQLEFTANVPPAHALSSVIMTGITFNSQSAYLHSTSEARPVSLLVV